MSRLYVVESKADMDFGANSFAVTITLKTKDGNVEIELPWEGYDDMAAWFAHVRKDMVGPGDGTFARNNEARERLSKMHIY